MQQLTLTDILRMEDVLADARQILAEAQHVARGEKVKITFYSEDGQGPLSYCYPVRVAQYARRVLGPPAPFPETTRLSFTWGGCTLAHLPTVAGYRAFLRALLAHNEANLRRNKRQLARLLGKVSKPQKGGQPL